MCDNHEYTIFEGHALTVTTISNPTSHIIFIIQIRLERFEKIYGAAGHPNCIFRIDFKNLIKITQGIKEDIIE